MVAHVEYVCFETHLIEFDTYAPAGFMYHPLSCALEVVLLLRFS